MTDFAELLVHWKSGQYQPPIGRLVGFHLIDYQLSPPSSHLELEVREDHFNPMGIVHGGIFCDLADGAMGVAMAISLKEGQSFTTMDLQMRYFRSVKEGRLVARARLISEGRRTRSVECDVTDGEGNLVAKGSCSCMIFSV